MLMWNLRIPRLLQHPEQGARVCRPTGRAWLVILPPGTGVVVQDVLLLVLALTLGALCFARIMASEPARPAASAASAVLVHPDAVRASCTLLDRYAPWIRDLAPFGAEGNSDGLSHENRLRSWVHSLGEKSGGFHVLRCQYTGTEPRELELVLQTPDCEPEPLASWIARQPVWGGHLAWPVRAEVKPDGQGGLFATLRVRLSTPEWPDPVRRFWQQKARHAAPDNPESPPDHTLLSFVWLADNRWAFRLGRLLFTPGQRHDHTWLVCSISARLLVLQHRASGKILSWEAGNSGILMPSLDGTKKYLARGESLVTIDHGGASPTETGRGSPE
jgi:hypothetical protein